MHARFLKIIFISYKNLLPRSITINLKIDKLFFVKKLRILRYK